MIITFEALMLYSKVMQITGVLGLPHQESKANRRKAQFTGNETDISDVFFF